VADALFAHIERNGIPMTAPVETTFLARGPELDESSMAFLYGSLTQGSAGEQGSVDVVDVPGHLAVSIGMRGLASPERVEGARARLEDWIAARPEWRSSGPLRTMGYNSPRVRGDRRYFEVQIPVERAPSIVIDFGDPDEVRRWHAVDDVVMGGRSSSRLVVSAEDTALFVGELSLENNGGFASVRTSGARCSLVGARSVRLSVKGDGRTYRLRCVAETDIGEIGYQVSFQTRAGEWMEVELPLSDFEPRWRGRPVENAPALHPAAVHGLGLMIADGQQGVFRLELRSIARVTGPGPE